jgi:ATP-dependent helicase HrpA
VKPATHPRNPPPRPTFDPALPITAHREEILQAIAGHQVVIVAGETGSGKTTQLPKLCLEAGRGTRGLIGCTQPRRIAARAMAERVAEELGTELGQAVLPGGPRAQQPGRLHQVHDRRQPGGNRRTTGACAPTRPYHRRGARAQLNIDFLLGYLKQRCRRVATLAADHLHHRHGKVFLTFRRRSGRRGIRSRPPVDVLTAGGEAEAGERRLDLTAASPTPCGWAALTCCWETSCSSGERKMRPAAPAARLAGAPHDTEIPLLRALLGRAAARLSSARAPIILATNVAETSLTVPRIRFVIDSGLARISRYGHRSRIQRLPIESISQASANQRAGRCGRLSPGTCIRLYSEEDFAGRPEYTEPEILRTSLASVILRMLTMGLGAVEDFPFVDRPAPRMISDAYQLLFELAAIDEARAPTELGRRLARWPMDVRLARMVEEGARQGCLEDLLVLAAALSIQDPRERPLDAQAAADRRTPGFATQVRLCRPAAHVGPAARAAQGRFRQPVPQAVPPGIPQLAARAGVVRPLPAVARPARGAPAAERPPRQLRAKPKPAGRPCSASAAASTPRPAHLGARARTFYIFPGSGLFGSTPQWLMSAEIVETTRPYARGNAVIQPEWLEQQGAHLLKRRHFDPHWSRRRGAVLAWEQVTLYGLVLVEKRRVQFAAIDPAEARRIFIREALVRGELDTRAAFRAHNERIRAEVEALEHKRRRRDVLADEGALFEFFDARIPGDVNSSRSFEKWLAGLGDAQRQLLYLGHEVLMREDAGAAPRELYPDFLEMGCRRFALEYRFEPGHPDDGVVLSVPLELLNTLDPGRLQWLVPGLLRDKLEALIRQLPKPVRRALTPVPAFADALEQALRERRDQPLLPACAESCGA